MWRRTLAGLAVIFLFVAAASAEPLPKPSAPVPRQFIMPFAAKTREDAAAWQRKARASLLQLVEKQQPRVSTQEAPIDLQLGPPQDKGDYTLYSASFRGNNKTGLRWPGLLAIPKGAGPFPAMLALHGHGGSAEKVFDPKGLYKGFADRFARGGYVVFAPSFPHQKYAALVLWDLFRCVDILQSRPEVDPQRIGVAGLSMGGEWTMWIAACDERLKVAVVSGWMCTTEGVFAVPNCSCWQLPGLVELMDVCEVHLLIAPRPVVFESAELDPCFPIRYTREGFARIKAGYKVFGAEDAVAQDVWPAGHEWHGALAYPAVDKVLGGRAAKLVVASPVRSNDKPAPPKYDPTSHYVVQKIEGWTVRVHRRLLEDQKELGDRTLELLRVKLYDVRRAVPPGPLARLQQVPIWVESDNPQVKCMCYHPSKEWLAEHGFNPQKAGSVEIGNCRTFLSWTREQPMMVLHELAHAYHHLVLGWEHGEIEAAYRRAKESKSYESVPYFNGTNKRAYGMNDAKEYFAELTEAWFGENDFYPFVRAEVLKHDPKMAELLKKIWGR